MPPESQPSLRQLSTRRLEALAESWRNTTSSDPERRRDTLAALEELIATREDEDSAGAECSRLEADILDLHDQLERAGLPGAINAESVRERIELLVAARDGLGDSATRISAERDRQTRLYEAAMNYFPDDQWTAFEASDNFKEAEDRG